VNSAAANIPSKPIVRKAAPLSWLKPAVITGALVPLSVLFFRWQMGFLDSDKVSEILNYFGMLALIFLIASLACTPLKLIFGWTWGLRIRKELGVISFFYALGHFIVYFLFDKSLSVGAAIEDVLKRPFILVGFLAFLILLPLAMTSTARAVRRMGAKNWQRLHRLVYLAGILGALHFYMRVKSDVREPLLYAGVLGILLLARVIYRNTSNRTGGRLPKQTAE